jgi:hypothetical protein
MKIKFHCFFINGQLSRGDKEKGKKVTNHYWLDDLMPSIISATYRIVLCVVIFFWPTEYETKDKRNMLDDHFGFFPQSITFNTSQVSIFFHIFQSFINEWSHQEGLFRLNKHWTIPVFSASTLCAATEIFSWS